MIATDIDPFGRFRRRNIKIDMDLFEKTKPIYRRAK
jgi:hypothetical protein